MWLHRFFRLPFSICSIQKWSIKYYYIKCSKEFLVHGVLAYWYRSHCKDVKKRMHMLKTVKKAKPKTKMCLIKKRIFKQHEVRQRYWAPFKGNVKSILQNLRTIQEISGMNMLFHCMMTMFEIHLRSLYYSKILSVNSAS